MKLLTSVQKTPQVTHYIRGWVSMMVLVEALKRADKATGGKITGPAVKDALESFRDFDTGGLSPGKITYTATDHRPFMSVNVMEFEKGKPVIKKTMTLPRKAEWLGL
jgi:branched-chain amino acid transport system substrate-binding protein